MSSTHWFLFHFLELSDRLRGGKGSSVIIGLKRGVRRRSEPSGVDGEMARVKQESRKPDSVGQRRKKPASAG